MSIRDSLSVLFLGFLRGEMNFNSKDELVSQIEKDIDDTKESLAAPDCVKHQTDPLFRLNLDAGLG